MWLVCFISLALCLHFNEHATETGFQAHDYEAVIHTHHHEVSQSYAHSHQDHYYEHFVASEAIKLIALILLSLGAKIFDRSQNYIFLKASRIFKPPKQGVNIQITF